MAKRNIFNISEAGMQKEAYVQVLASLARAALPYLGRATLEVGKVVAVDRALGFITKQVAERGVRAVISSLTRGGGKDVADVQKLLSSVLKADKGSPFTKDLIPDEKSRRMLERLSDGLHSSSDGGRGSRRRGGIMDMISGRGRSEWKRENNPFQEPEGVRLARRMS